MASIFFPKGNLSGLFFYHTRDIGELKSEEFDNIVIFSPGSTYSTDLLLNLIRNLQEQKTAHVRVDTDLSSPFPTSSGVHQGCVLAPSLFCCAMDWIMPRCTNQLQINVGREIITDLLDADL